MDTLSKSDFVALGGDDVPGDRLRTRVLMLEGLVVELWESLDGVLSLSSSFLGSTETKKAAALRAAQALDEVQRKWPRGFRR